jgi:hypothetical protein
MEQTKKPNIIAISMVFLALSVVFIAMAYGYGQGNQMKADVEYYKNINNLEGVARNLGYSLTKLEIINPSYVIENNESIFLNNTNITT